MNERSLIGLTAPDIAHRSVIASQNTIQAIPSSHNTPIFNKFYSIYQILNGTQSYVFSE